MTENFLEKMFEHNNWANQSIIQACSSLSDEQLDAVPQSVTKGTIRRTLLHLVGSQNGYLSLLTLPVEERFSVRAKTFIELQESASKSSEGLLAGKRRSKSPEGSASNNRRVLRGTLGGHAPGYQSRARTPRTDLQHAERAGDNPSELGWMELWGSLQRAHPDLKVSSQRGSHYN